MRVLIADDDPALRHGLLTHLRSSQLPASSFQTDGMEDCGFQLQLTT